MTKDKTLNLKKLDLIFSSSFKLTDKSYLKTKRKFRR